MKDSLETLEAKIGYHFKNIELLRTAVTHSSYANEHHCKSYERLEFLGDSVLGFVTAEYLFENYSDLPEGKLTKNRAALVCEKSLCVFSREIGVGDYMRLSHGEIHTCGNDRPICLSQSLPQFTLTAVRLTRRENLFSLISHRRQRQSARRNIRIIKLLYRRLSSKTPRSTSSMFWLASPVPTTTSILSLRFTLTAM